MLHQSRIGGSFAGHVVVAFQEKVHVCREPLSLVISQDEISKRGHVAQTSKTLSVARNEILDQILDILLLDELEQLEACGAEQIVPGHGFYKDIKRGAQGSLLYDLLDVEVLLHADEAAEKSYSN